jgi:hypothetical protein
VTVAGYVDGNGAIAAGTGFTVAHPNADKFTITFTPSFSYFPVVTVTTADQTTCWINGIGFNTVDVYCSAPNQFFGFIAVLS